MKTLLLVLAAAGLPGCAVYPAPAYETYGPGPPYVVEQPGYIYGSAFWYGGFPHAHPRGFNRVHPGAFPGHPPRPHVNGLRPDQGARFGGGIRNPMDSQPNNRGDR